MAAVAHRWQKDAAGYWQQLITNGKSCVPTLQQVPTHGNNCLSWQHLLTNGSSKAAVADRWPSNAAVAARWQQLLTNDKIPPLDPAW
jgi:hypothetical protein